MSVDLVLKDSLGCESVELGVHLDPLVELVLLIGLQESSVDWKQDVDLAGLSDNLLCKGVILSQQNIERSPERDNLDVRAG